MCPYPESSEVADDAGEGVPSVRIIDEDDGEDTLESKQAPTSTSLLTVTMLRLSAPTCSKTPSWQ